ncbi:MAG: tRNA pseudouridine(55) synthase TruB [Sporichthyaceae bacterium]
MSGDCLVVVDKPGGLTSHDVVARVRRLADTRRVGHAGTLDPMATGVLVLGVNRATRLLGHLTLTEKAYDATIRLGATTVTDDAEGDVVTTADASGVAEAAVAAGVAALTGQIAQVPSAVSAVKIDGKRAYKRVREGENVVLPSRPITVRTFEVLGIRRGAGYLDLDVRVECSSGTYVRALARDLGAGLGVGGHLTALRRTRVGPYALDVAHTLEQLADDLVVLPIADAARAAFPARELDADAAGVISHGGPLPAGGTRGPVAVFGPDGTFLALVEDHGATTKALAVFV